MILAIPSLTALTSPVSSTRATSVSLDAHAKAVTAATEWPFASIASATRRTVSPKATSVSSSGDTSTALTTWATVTAAVPEAEPAVTVIVAAPLVAAVTIPDASTGATEASLLTHATVAPAITCPFWSRTSAVSRVVSSREVSMAEAGLTVTVVATGTGGGGAGSTAPSPQDRTRRTIPPRTTAEIAKLAFPPGPPALPHL